VDTAQLNPLVNLPIVDRIHWGLYWPRTVEKVVQYSPSNSHQGWWTCATYMRISRSKPRHTVNAVTYCCYGRLVLIRIAKFIKTALDNIWRASGQQVSNLIALRCMASTAEVCLHRELGLACLSAQACKLIGHKTWICSHSCQQQH
jgi:hypothetical protein